MNVKHKIEIEERIQCLVLVLSYDETRRPPLAVVIGRGRDRN